MPLPTATLVPRRSRNPLSRQKVGWALVARNGRSVAVSGEKYVHGGDALVGAVLTTGIGYGAKVTEADNSAYNIIFSPEWTEAERKHAARVIGNRS